MTYAEINKILSKQSYHFEINPSHCGKAVMDRSEFPVDKNFNKFMDVFDSVGWESKPHLIYAKLVDDDRFIEFLASKFSVDKTEITSSIDVYIDRLAAQNNQTRSEYLAGWMREQMVTLTAILSGKFGVSVKGSQKDLADAIENSALILAHLQNSKDPMEIEDILLKLAVEAGNYCARGIKRASNEIVAGILQNARISKGEETDPIREYEIQILQALQTKRYQIVENRYQEICNQLGVPDVISQDVHGFDIYRLYLSLGFYPLTAQERFDVGVEHIAVWELFAPHNIQMNNLYENKLEEAILDIGNQKFTDYMTGVITQNNNLDDNQKEELMDRLASPEFSKFYNVLLMRLGVLREVI